MLCGCPCASDVFTLQIHSKLQLCPHQPVPELVKMGKLLKFDLHIKGMAVGPVVQIAVDTGLRVCSWVLYLSFLVGLRAELRFCNILISP